MSRVVRGLLIVGVAGALLLLVRAGVRVAERGRFASPYSTYGAGPLGTRALLLMTRSLGFQAKPLTRELTHLPRGTVVLIAGCRGELLRAVARPERESLDRWVQEGGLLVVAGHADVLPPGAGLSLAAKQPCAAKPEEQPANEPQDVLAVGPPLTHLLSFKAPWVLPLKTADDAHATEILSSQRGPVGLTAPHGRGRVVLLGIPDALTNRHVSDGAGIAFARILKAFAPAGPVLFDEYHLGMGGRRTVVGYLRDLGWSSLLAQLALALLIAGLSPMARLLPPRDPPQHHAPHSFLTTLTRLFARTRDHQGALARLSQHALQRMARRYGARHVARERLAVHFEQQGLPQLAARVNTILTLGQKPLAQGETLHERAAQIDHDV